jgi:hypothetical protein
MVAVANASGIFQSFGYSFDDPNGHIQELTTETKEHMDAMPPFITTWQAQDIANNDVGGYYQNPMATVSNLIVQNATIIYNTANTANITNVANVKSSALALSTAASSFGTHTSKLSGLTPYDGTDTVSPYMDMAVSAGRTAMYITYQTDGITNNAPIMGSFTSLMIEPQLSSNNVTLNTYREIFANSVVTSTNTTFDIVLQQDVTTTTVYSNLTSTSMTTLITQMDNMTDVMDNRRTSDCNFYSNVRGFIEKYNKTKVLNNMGETEKYLVNNLIGTEKAKTRIA